MMEKKGIFARQLVIGLLVLALCAGSVFAAQDYLIPGGYTVGIELEMRGVLVVDVEDGTCAAEAGVQKGDTIIRINGAEAAGAEMLRDAAGEESVVLTVLRDGKEAEFYIAAQRCGRLGLRCGTASPDRHGDIYRPGDGGVWCAGARCERPRHDAAAAGGVRGAGSGQRAVGQEGRAGHAGRAARDV